MKRPYKIIFVIPHLYGGGAERSVITIMNHLDRRVFCPQAIIFHKIREINLGLRNDIPLICLNKKSRYEVLRLVYYIYKIIDREKPALLFPQMPYANFITLLAQRLARHKAPVIISQRNNLSEELKHESFTRLKSRIAAFLYPQADLIHCNAQGIKSELVANFDLPSNKIQVIYNAFDLRAIAVQALQGVEHDWFKDNVPILLACGRLTTQKNYPLLFRAVRRVLEKRPVRLIVLGEGEERRSLEDYISHLGLSSLVAFLGFQLNPFAYMAKATALVISSSYEGFPRTIVEAMACRLPVVGRKKSSPPRLTAFWCRWMMRRPWPKPY